ncbi:2-dehydro-3-deoxyglucarate aldolase/4-hydroxy-2-oxoheptanedioate aldolase [Paraburkholderia sp. BL23I1N1]|uniref:HpcH/HpaI aldolase family protein n=1 Tax=Paraburkholderia sp. BL23I1N1 TaxID=1938802 RepID=UPI000FF052E7|nr:aldolase/citrate lyase family protein [Paraburkholderia sp. BL23I1N1]RKE39481.1 2-dehydro-3-deoxyglucarate aldolase/4-hydroxy-2-oxoheptanedioate aldolase [Paraburkholderia sp. BL23I1N1]
MLFQSFKQALLGKKPLDLIWLALGSVPMAEFATFAKPDALVLDLQHGLWDRGTLEAAIGVAGTRLPVIARCAENSPHAIARALDAGAASVLVPLIETAEDARRAVSAGRYPPFGNRSAGGVRPLLAGVDAMLAADREVAVGMLIETAHGVDNVEAIAAVPGVDYLFIGTGDLSLSREGDNEQIGRDCERILRAARAHDLPCGIFTRDAKAARQAFANGYQMAVCANDIDLVKQGFLSALKQVSQ